MPSGPRSGRPKRRKKPALRPPAIFLDSWQKAQDQTASLRLQQILTRRAAERAAEVARLRYQAYKLGQLRYLDVEDANLKEVQAKVDAATTNVNLLIQLANLESLSEE